MVVTPQEASRTLSLSLFEPVVAVDTVDGQWYALISDGKSEKDVVTWPLEGYRIEADDNTVITIQLHLAEDELQFFRGQGQCFAEVHVPAAQVISGNKGSLVQSWFGLQRGRQFGAVTVEDAERLFEVGTLLAQNLLTPKVCCSLVDESLNCSPASEGPLLRSVTQQSSIIRQMHRQLRALWKQRRLVCGEDFVVALEDTEVEDTDASAAEASALSEAERRRRYLAGMLMGEPADDEEKLLRLQDEYDRLAEAMQQLSLRLDDTERECHGYREQLADASNRSADEQQALAAERERASNLAKQLGFEKLQSAKLQQQHLEANSQDVEIAKRDAEIIALKEELQASRGACKPFASTSSTSSPWSRRPLNPAQARSPQAQPPRGNPCPRTSSRQRSTSPPLPDEAATGKPAPPASAKGNGIAWQAEPDSQKEAPDVEIGVEASLEAELLVKSAQFQEKERAWNESKASLEAELQAAKDGHRNREANLMYELQELESASGQLQQQHARQLDALLSKQERTAAEVRLLRDQQDFCERNPGAGGQTVRRVFAPRNGNVARGAMVRGVSMDSLTANSMQATVYEASSHNGRRSVEVAKPLAAKRAWSAERYPNAAIRSGLPVTPLVSSPATERYFPGQQQRSASTGPVGPMPSGGMSPCPAAQRRTQSPTPSIPVASTPALKTPGIPVVGSSNSFTAAPNSFTTNSPSTSYTAAPPQVTALAPPGSGCPGAAMGPVIRRTVAPGSSAVPSQGVTVGRPVGQMVAIRPVR